MKHYTTTEAAAKLGLCAITLAKYIKLRVVQPTGSIGRRRYWDENGLAQAAMALSLYKRERFEQRKGQLEQRARELAEKYKSGLTLEQIGAQENVTRERIRQILSKIGVDRSMGAGSVRAKSASAKNEANRNDRRERHCQKSYGCSFAEFQSVTGAKKLNRKNSNRLISLWWHHKNNANRLGLDWLFTLPTYAALIGDRVNLFKREREGLVLHRKDKSGPYSPENCEVTTLAMSSR